jgi:hypothetical protein
MTSHDMNGSAKKLRSYKKSMISVIIALLLVSSAVGLTLSPFQKASAQKSVPLTRLPGNTNQEQQQTTTSDAASKKSQGAFSSFNRQAQLEANDGNQGQGQQGQQSNPGQGEEHRQEGKAKGKNKHNVEEDFVPIATSGNNNVYVVWPSNKTTADFEIMFKASSDGGKMFSPKINLSNSPGIDSERPQIAAAGNNVYVTWWERTNATSNEPVMKISTDNGKTFGQLIMLSEK